jgi:hypothetical protein
MDQVTKGSVPDDEELGRFGYRQQFVRSLRQFESFAVAFSFISITTGIFTTYGFALATGGTRAIWTWPIVIVGQSLVALVYGALSVRVPLSGYSYQWASRLASVQVGWWFAWMSFAFGDHRHRVGADRGRGPVDGALVQPRRHRRGPARRVLQLARPVHAGHAARGVHHRGFRVGQQPGRGDPRAA